MITLYNPSYDLPRWIKKYRCWVFAVKNIVESYGSGKSKSAGRDLSEFTSASEELERLYNEGGKTNNYPEL